MSNHNNIEIEEGGNKSSLKGFIETYKPQFKRYDNYLKKDSNFFWLKPSDTKALEFELQRDMVAIILDRLKYYNKNFKAYFDLKYAFDFGMFMEEAANHFISNCEFYLDNNRWEDLYDDDNIEREEDALSRELKIKAKAKEIKLQSSIVSALAKFRDVLSNYKMVDDSDIVDMSLPIEGDKKVPLLMKDKIETIFNQVKSFNNLSTDVTTHTSSYDLNNSNQFFKNIKNPPPYDKFKSFWEQGKDTIDFYLEEKDKIINGINIAGIHISGLLYWHTNFFKTSLPSEALKGRPEYDPNKKNIIATPNLRDNELYFDYFYKKAEEEGKGLFIFGTRRFAKALYNFENLIYADGQHKNIGEAKVGDIIFGDNGRLTTITGVYPQGIKQLYKIVFKDGREIKCCGEHIWRFINKDTRKQEDNTLEGWMNTPISKLLLPNISPLEYKNSYTPFINPYLLGSYLSIGTCNNDVIFNKVPRQHKNKLIDNLYADEIQFSYDGEDIVLLDADNLVTNIKTKGLDKNKFIPKQCFKWSTEDRIELLQGLVESSKQNIKQKKVRIHSSELGFINSVVRLCRELGIVSKVLKGKNNYVCFIYLNTFFNKTRGVGIKSIEKSGYGEATCITVDNNNQMFLTSDYIPTHNTTIESSLLSRSATIFANSQNLVIGGSSGDLDNLSNALENAFLNIHPAFLLPRNNNDWKRHIQFGLKHKSGERIPYSDIYIRNVNSGKGGGELKVAGNTPDVWIVDEAGKFDVAPVYKQGEPSFDTPYGLRLVPILVGCLTEDNYLFDRQGKPIKIKEALKRNNEVTGWGGSSCSVEKISHRNPVVRKECVKVTFENGVEVSCSKDHPFMQILINEKRFRKNLVFEGIAKAKEINTLMPGDLVAFPDYMSFHNRTIRNFYKGDSKDRLVKSIFSVLDGKKTFGDSILAAGNKILKLFLIELFKLKGGCTSKGKNYIFWVLPNIELATELRFLLLKIGVHTKVIRTGNVFEVCTYSDIDSFRLYNNVFKGVLPLNVYSTAMDDEITLKERKLSKSRYYFDYNLDNGKGEYFTNLWRHKISNIRPMRIVSIEDIGTKEVFNFTADKTHTYIANGVITFNTGGNAKFSASAQDMLTNPEAYGLLPMDWDYLDNMIGGNINIPYTRRNFGIFVPAHLSYKKGLVKKKTNLADYFNINNKRLKEIELEVTDWVNARDLIEKDREAKKKSRDSLNSEKMAYPIDPLECFLATDESPFTCIAEAIAHRDKIRSDGDIGEYVDLKRTQDGRIHRVDSNKQVPDFPFKGGNIDAPVVIFSPPPEVPMFNNTFVSGLDHYKHDKSSTDSVGVLYTFKRKINLDAWSGRFVACYASRPDTMKQFNTTCEMVLDAYGSKVLQENADISFQHFLAEKNREDFLLAKGEEMVRMTVNPRASQNNKFGLNPNKANQDYLFKLFVAYCNEIIGDGEDGGITRGVERIPDPFLLDEIIGFYYGGNFDRITAASHALAWARYLDSIGVMPDVYNTNNHNKSRKEFLERKRRVNNLYRGVKKPKKNKNSSFF